MNNDFPATLRQLRIAAHLTDPELAELANVPRSLICGLQNRQRTAGELQARRIGKALGLIGDGLEEFVLLALNACSHKVLKEHKSYPALVLNFLAQQLRAAGVFPEHIQELKVTNDDTESGISLVLDGGRMAMVQMQIQ